MEFGAVYPPVLGATADVARKLEDAGFDLFLCSDTPNVAPDPYPALALAAAATSRIRIGPGVTNLVTRHPAVTASAAMSLQAQSGGRVVLGVGRGDSALAHAGLPTPTTAQMLAGLRRLRAYVRGEAVDVGGGAALESRLRWLAGTDIPPVPLDVAATGPRTLRMAADVAERISLSVGADPDQIRAAVAVVTDRLAEIGRPRSDVSIGAYLPLVAAGDAGTAVRLARAGAGLLAHLPATPGGDDSALPEAWRRLSRRLRQEYDMARHSRSDGSHLALVDDEFVRWFGIAGEPGYCVERLQELAELGIEHVYALGAVEPGQRAAVPEEWLASHRLLAEAVMPQLRG